MTSHAGLRTVMPTLRRNTSHVSRAMSMWGCLRLSGHVAERPAGLAQEHVVEAGPGQGDRAELQPGAVQQPEDGGQRDLSVLDGQPHLVAGELELAHERLRR